jgi:hypothetical protein
MDPFNELYIRSWRDVARYRGPEALGKEGPRALMRLPMLMEEVLEEWEKESWSPRFKAEYMVTHNIVASLAEAPAAALRLNLNAAGPKHEKCYTDTPGCRTSTNRFALSLGIQT